MTQLKAYKIKMTVVAPFHFPSEAFGRFGFDSIGLRTDEGKPVIPRDQVKGILLHGLTALVALGDEGAEKLIGLWGRAGPNLAPPPKSAEDASDAAGDYETRTKGMLSVTDAVGVAKLDDTIEPAPRVAIGEESGAARPGHLLLTEQMVHPLEEVNFEATLYLLQAENSDFSSVIERGLQFHTAVGSQKSVGLGRIKNIDVASCEVPKAFDGLTFSETSSLERLRWEFELDRPYLVGSKRLAENAYLGAQDISGGALKGLLSNHLSQAGSLDPEMSEALSALKISFAQPIGATSPQPLSVVKDEFNEDYVDLADPNFEARSPSKLVHQRDWKPNEREVDEHFENRVHVKIDPESGGVEKHMLYTSHARISPESGFEAELDFERVTPAHRPKLLKALSEPMLGLGRTDALLTTEKLAEAQTDRPSITEHGRIALVLDTAALLIDEADGHTCDAAYTKFWTNVLPGAKLKASFAAQTLVGGYQAMRFGQEGKYRPFVLTSAGSVFVLEVPEKALLELNALMCVGLCLESWGGEETSWKNCPFVPENGYGQFRQHQPRHGGFQL